MFDAADTLALCLAATAAMIGVTVDRERLAAAAAVGHRPRPISPTGWSGAWA